jgi:hypothetical protein
LKKGYQIELTQVFGDHGSDWDASQACQPAQYIKGYCYPISYGWLIALQTDQQRNNKKMSKSKLVSQSVSHLLFFIDKDQVVIDYNHSS